MLIVDRLPRGVTGFDGSGKGPPPEVAAHEFKAACQAAARAWGGTVCSFQGSAYPFNYHGAVLEREGTRLSVLCNTHYPLVAFMDPADPAPRYVDAPELHRFFREQTEFTPLDTEFLRANPTREHLRDLGPTELQQIDYWRPENLGEIIFNGWD